MTNECTSFFLPMENAFVSNTFEVRSGLTLLHQSCAKNYSKLLKVVHGLSLDLVSTGITKAEYI